MKFPITRMDLLFWRDIKYLGLKPKQIQKNAKLSHFNKIYNEYSLFHFFAGNTQVIEIIYDLYKEAENNDELSDDDKLIPLLLLTPDVNGKTAIDIAL